MGPRRYLDRWVADKLMIDRLTSTSGCACCGLSHGLTDPEELRRMCSDVESDDGKTTTMTSYFPEDVKIDIWRGRVWLRQQMKTKMLKYQQFLQNNRYELRLFWSSIPIDVRQRLTTIPSTDFMCRIGSRYHVSGIYLSLLNSIFTQVIHFERTSYPPDGLTSDEVQLERAIRVCGDRLGLEKTFLCGSNENSPFLMAVDRLAGPKLLSRRSAEREPKTEVAEEGQSDSQDQLRLGFKGDRRIMRLLLMQEFADSVISSFQESQKSLTHEEPSYTEL